MLVDADLAVVVHDPEVDTPVVKLPTCALAATVVGHMIEDVTVLVVVQDTASVHGLSTRRLLAVESSDRGHRDRPFENHLGQIFLRRGLKGKVKRVVRA